MNYKNQYKKAVGNILNTNPNHLFFYWKGRIALYAALKALNIKKGDEVILPAFTCVVVPNAIKYLEATPIYVDIDDQTYNTTLEKIKAKRTPNTKAIIIQNTFGLTSNVDEISDYCKKENIPSIEDCTHGFGGTYNNKPNGSFCDFAFYSTQWNKPYSTGIGGILMVNNSAYIPIIQSIEKELIQPSFKDKAILKALIFARENILNSKNYWTLLKLYRWLSKHKLVIGSSSPDELASTTMPKNYFKASSSVQYKTGLKNLKKLENTLQIRIENAKIYSKFLKEKGKTFVNESLFQNHSFLKYPLLVNNRTTFIEEAEKVNIDIGEWFVSPLHPIESDLSSWDLDIEQFPTAKEKASKMVNLPTDTEDISHVLNFLENNINLIC